jgi:hypothetical protein
VDTLEQLANKLQATQAAASAELRAQATKLRQELAAVPPPEPKPPPPPEVLLPRHLAKLRRLRHNVERQQKALDKATAARDEAQVALDTQADRLNAAKQRLEDAEQTRLTLLQALPTSGSSTTTHGLSGTVAPSTPLVGCPNALPEVLQFLGHLLTPTDVDDATRLAQLGKLADSLRQGLSSRYSDPAAMAAALLRPSPETAASPEVGDEAMHTADEAGHHGTGERAVAVRLPDNKRRKGEPRESSGSDADEEKEEAPSRGEDAARRRRSRTPPSGTGSGGLRARGPGSPATASDS